MIDKDYAHINIRLTAPSGECIHSGACQGLHDAAYNLVERTLSEDVKKLVQFSKKDIESVKYYDINCDLVKVLYWVGNSNCYAEFPNYVLEDEINRLTGDKNG